MKINKILAGIAMAGLMYAGFAYADTGLNTTQKKQVEDAVRDYIIKNLEVLVQSLQSFQQKQMEQTQKTFVKIQEAAPKYADRLFHQANDPIAGNPNGTITLVEFSDYQCPHCVDMTQVVDNLIKANPNLRVVLKEFPIRGPMSETAAKAALASAKQNKYFVFHNALMNTKVQPLTDAAIYDIAKSVGLNVDQLKTDMKSNDVGKQIKDNYELAQKLQLMFTPVFFIAKTSINTNSSPDEVIFIPGAMSEDKLNEAIQKLGS